MTISHLRLERKKEEMAKKVETVIDDLARLKLVRQIVDEQIQLRQNILRERLSKNLKTKRKLYSTQILDRKSSDPDRKNTDILGAQ